MQRSEAQLGCRGWTMRNSRGIRVIPRKVRRELTSICTKGKEWRIVKHQSSNKTKTEGAGRRRGTWKRFKKLADQRQGSGSSTRARLARGDNRGVKVTVKKEIEDPRIVGEQRGFLKVFRQ